LIDHNNSTWNYPLSSYYFDQNVVQDIIRTPIFRQVEEDQINLEIREEWAVFGQKCVSFVYGKYSRQFTLVPGKKLG
jgi:hypothetical protein